MGKKNKLTPSHEIYNRIRWDPSLDQNEFIIGYLDRFVGIMEMAFNNFQYSDVPHHRVRYFAYKNKIVWDRENRLDMLTGAKDFSFLKEDSSSDENENNLNETENNNFDNENLETESNTSSPLQPHQNYRVFPVGTIFTEEELKESKENFNFRLSEIQNNLKTSKNDNKYDLSINDLYSTTEKDRVRGSLFGLAWGDVLGCPVEGFRWYKIYSLFNDSSSSSSATEIPSSGNKPVLPPLDINMTNTYTQIPSDYSSPTFLDRLKNIDPKHNGIRILRKLRPQGLHSDDTQQALALIACCQDNKEYIGFDKNRFAKWIAQGHATYSWRGIGSTFANACREYIKGTPPEKGGRRSQSIGACMRIGPLGALLRHDSVEQLADVCFSSTLITHRSLICASTSFAIAYCVRELCLGTHIDTVRRYLPSVVQEQEDLLRSDVCSAWGLSEDEVNQEAGQISSVLKRILDFTSISFDLKDNRNGNKDNNENNNNNNNLNNNNNEEEEQKKKLLYRMRELIINIAQETMSEINPLSGRKQTRIVSFHPNKGNILLGAIHAIACGLFPSISNPNNMLLDIIQLGDDTDSVAAIAGTIMGARFGSDWIPSEYLFDRERFEQYSDYLIDREHAPAESTEEFMKHESMLCLWERDFQRNLQKLNSK